MALLPRQGACPVPSAPTTTERLDFVREIGGTEKPIDSDVIPQQSNRSRPLLETSSHPPQTRNPHPF